MKLTSEQKLSAKPMPPFIRPLRDANRLDLKTQTRRMRGLDLINEAPHDWKINKIIQVGEFCYANFISFTRNDIKQIKCPYGKPGDIRYMLEPIERHSGGLIAIYSDDKQPIFNEGGIGNVHWIWKIKRLSQLHLPKRFARTFFRIKDIDCQPVQNITEADAIAEAVAIDKGHAYIVVGHPEWAHATARGCFETIFDSINSEPDKELPFTKNIFVWVITYERLK